MNKKILFAIASVASFTSLSSFAQVPTTAESERLTERFKKEKLQSKTTNQILIQDQQQQPDVKGADQIKLKLSSVEIEGNTVFSNDELEALYKGKYGENVTLADVYSIRDSITKKYREAGYVISRAVIPAQDFDKSAAKIKIRVIEGLC